MSKGDSLHGNFECTNISRIDRIHCSKFCSCNSLKNTYGSCKKIGLSCLKAIEVGGEKAFEILSVFIILFKKALFVK